MALAARAWDESKHPRGESHPRTTPGSFVEALGDPGKIEDIDDPEQRRRITALLQQAAADPDVAEAERQILARGDSRNDPGVLGPDGNYTPAALAQNDVIARAFLNEAARAAPGQAPVATIMMGMPGAGKSTVLGLPEMRNFMPHSVVINSDEIQKLLPGWRPVLAACYHERAADIANGHLWPAVVRGRYNLVWDSAGRNPEKMAEKVHLLRSLGYRVNVVWVETDLATSVERAYGRFKRGDRYVPLRTVIDRPNGPRTSFYRLIHSNAVDKWRHYDTNSKPPRLVNG